MPSIKLSDYLDEASYTASGNNRTFADTQGLNKPESVEAQASFSTLIKDAFASENVIGSYLQVPDDVRRYQSPNNRVLNQDGYKPFSYLAKLGRLPDATAVAYANSDQEVDRILSFVDEQNERRARLFNSDWLGTVAEVAAGLADPTLILPSTAAVKAGSLAGRTLSGFSRGAVLTGGAVAIQENLLHDTQTERTIEESAYATLAGAMLGGIISGASASVSRGRSVTPEAMEAQAKEFNAGVLQSFGLNRTRQTPLDDIPNMAKFAEDVNRYTKEITDAVKRNRKPIVVGAVAGGTLGVASEAEAAGEGATTAQAITAIIGAAAGAILSRGKGLPKSIRKLRERAVKTAEANARAKAALEGGEEFDPSIRAVVQPNGSVKVEGHFLSDEGIAYGDQVINKALIRATDPNFLGNRPVVHGLSSDSVTLRKLTNRLFNHTFKLGKNLRGEVSEDSVQSLAQFDMKQVADKMFEVDKIYAHYIGVPATTLGRVKGAIKATAFDDVMSRSDFDDLVGQAMMRGDKSEIPQVEEAAKVYRSLITPAYKRAQELGIIPDPVKQLQDKIDELKVQAKEVSESVKADTDKFKQASAEPTEGTIATPRGTVYKDTRGENRIFHGSPNEITANNQHYSTLNIFGQGFYTTDAVDIADGYARRGGAKQPIFYEVTEKSGVKLYDMEEVVSPELLSKVRRAIGRDNFDDLDIPDKPNMREIYNSLREDSEGLGLSSDDVQEIFDSVRRVLEKEGFEGFTHVGGMATGREAHKVRIYWEPEKNLNLKKVEVDDLEVRPEKPSSLVKQESKLKTLEGQISRREKKLQEMIDNPQKVKNAESYFTTVYNFPRIHANRKAFVQDYANSMIKQGYATKKAYKEAYSVLETLTTRTSDEFVINSVTKRLATGAGGISKMRVSNALQEDMLKWLHTDATIVVGNYMKTLSSATRFKEMLDEFGVSSVKGLQQKIEKDFDNLIKLNQGDQKTVDKLLAEKNKSIQFAGDIAALSLGQFRRAGSNDKFLRNLRKFVAVVQLGGVTISSIPEKGAHILKNGLPSSIKQGLKGNIEAIRAISKDKKALSDLVLGLEVEQNEILNTLLSNDLGANVARSKADKTFDALGAGLTKLTGLKWWTDMNRRLAAHEISAEIIRTVEKAKAGKELSRAEVKRLSHLGISEEHYDAIHAMYKKHGTEVQGSYISHFEDWSDTEIQKRFMLSVRKGVDGTVLLRGSTGAVPLAFQKTELGGVIGQLKTFQFLATDKYLLESATELSDPMGRRGMVLQGIVTLVALGMMTQAAKDLIAGKELMGFEENYGDWLSAGISRSGLAGILEIPLFGLNPWINDGRYAGQNVVDIVGGPSLGMIRNGYRAISGFTDFDIDEADQQAIIKMVPYQNLFYLRAGFELTKGDD